MSLTITRESGVLGIYDDPSPAVRMFVIDGNLILSRTDSGLHLPICGTMKFSELSEFFAEISPKVVNRAWQSIQRWLKGGGLQ